MQLLNNLDIIILIVVAISSFLAFNRGILKEVFSILGWTMIIFVSVFLLPILNEIISRYVEDVALVSVIAMAFILLVLFIFWSLFTKKIVGKIRDSKLSYFDKVFGFMFGFARGILMIVLFYILVNWITPKEYQTETLKDSVYFEMAGVLAKPLEKLIPEATLKNIHEKSSIERFINDMDSNDDMGSLFDKLSQPQIKKLEKQSEKLDEDAGVVKEEIESYQD